MYLYQYTIRIEWNFSDIIFQKYLKNKYWKDQNPFKQILDSSNISST